MKSKKWWSVLLVAVMVVTMLAGCGNSNKGSGGGAGNDSGTEPDVNSGQADEDSSAGDKAEGAVYNIAANTWGVGAYPLDIITHAENKIVNLTGAKLDVADNQFTADKVVTDLESQLATNPDGVLMMTVVDAVFGTIKEKCNSANVPYVLDTNFPSDEKLMEEIKADPLFLGGATASQYLIGKEIAGAVLADGHQTVVILAAAAGDYSHDTRIEGFTDAFEAAGGEIAQVMHCSDPSEATTKANDLLTANPDVDAIYATGGDFLSALVAIKTSDAGAKYALYGTDIAPDLIDGVIDGTISAMNGGQHLCGAMVMTMLINYLDGHQILDDNGKPPVIDYFATYSVTQENAEGFKVLYSQDSCFITEEEFKVLLYRYNPDVSFADYDKFSKDYPDTVYEKAAAAIK